MDQFQFSALGTEWSISVDHSVRISDAIWQAIMDRTEEFDQRQSRFILSSEANKFRDAKAGTYPISTELCELLVASDQLRELTDGAFDPAIGGFLELTGYSYDYGFQPKENEMKNWNLPRWSVDAEKLTVTIDGPVVFDSGGIGKGYWIDQISQFLLKNGVAHHLVDGGGDMMGTTKANGDGWKIALEWPGKSDMALGTVILKNQGLAVSDTFKRNWGEWHHLQNPLTKQSVHQILGCMAVAPNAFVADQMTSALSQVSVSTYPVVREKLGGEYLVLLVNGDAHVSPQWSGEFFQ